MAKKKSPLKKAKEKAWKECSRYIRLRDSNSQGIAKCCTCNYREHWKKLQAGHFIPGRTNAILFDERGLAAQCYGCNVRAQGNGPEYYIYMLNKHGQRVIDELRAKKHQTVKYTVAELEVIAQDFKERADELESSID